ncbi:phytoene/squalene synthase family protein [Kineococcus rhizosphaerae]|uniref:Phytoene synthase n=1 Tax=Kineococcus rhizosphaerae TaxID=559628 RepID=A0A2T0R8M6_9ACTN|nr:phytoene/squalene synthase family protein [Kineococcus rhizosphaerae]PRY17502.1 phytoene synthase [Kineococcus rhizosphaerae]
MIPRSTRLCLDAAAEQDPALRDPALREAFELCRRLHAEHGKTYYLATLLLPPGKRPYVWALYGFARYADEFVDSLTDPDPDALLAWSDDFLKSLDDDEQPEPVGRAMAATMRRWDLPRDQVEAFLDSMRWDITETGWDTYEDLNRYVYGSAAVIGLQMLPILEPLTPEATPRARALGEAFQLTNFVRDVGEDLDRGRVYLPAEDLERFGLTREDLFAARAEGRTPERVRDLLAFEADRTRELYAFAEPGLDMVHPTSRDCLRTAYLLYGGILDQVAAVDYDVLGRRVRVGLPRRLAVALPGLVRARLARRDEARWRSA